MEPKRTPARKRERILERARRRYRDLQRQKHREPEDQGPYGRPRRLLPWVRGLTLALGAVVFLVLLVDRITLMTKLPGDAAFKLFLWMFLELAVVLLVTGVLYLVLWGVQGILDGAEATKLVVDEVSTSGERLTEIAEATVDSGEE